MLLEDVTVHAPQTGPSHASILTGRLPFEHGVRDNFSPPLRPGLPTLASVLQREGYRTAAFIGSITVSSRTGLDRGFSTYDDPFSREGRRRLITGSERRAAEVVDATLAWLQTPTRKEGHFFAWVHLYDPHAPYEPPRPFVERLEDPYDGEVAYADEQVGRLLRFLDEEGLRSSTLFVLTSDHGEGLGEHGEDEHLLFVYDSTLRVPLILSWPSILPEGQRLSGQFRSMDLMATLLDLMGVSPPSGAGESRAAAVREARPVPDAASYAESLYGTLHFGYAPLRALRADGWKYIAAPRAELYDLERDPGETRNLVEDEAARTDRMRRRLAELDSSIPAPIEAAPVDGGDLERLIALGYVGGGLSADAAGADPKDRIEEYQGYKRGVQEARRLLLKGEVRAALPILERLSSAEAVSFEVESMRGQALLHERRFEEAIASFRTALALLPGFVQSYLGLSLALRETGRYDEARRVLERGLETDPESTDLLRAHGVLLRGLGDLRAARRSLENARRLDPDDVQVRLALSAVYRDQGEAEAAVAEVRAAVQIDPRFGDGWNALGVLLSGAGRDVEARDAFENLLDLRPSDPDALFNLAALHLKSGRPAEARLLLETLLARHPSFPGAREALARARRGRPAGAREP